jgi:uncharacterized protein YndB with AHSA1/START domain
MAREPLIFKVIDSDTRGVDARMEIDAPVDAVWKALTDAEELTQWFPLEARVEPGVGGSVLWSWGPSQEWQNEIEIWEPQKRLRLVERVPAPRGGAASPDVPATEPAMLVRDFHLEAGESGTVLRLVHSGFGRGADWNGMFDGVRRGWSFELRGLRHYLEHHRGRRRTMVWLRSKLTGSFAKAWARLMSDAGLAPESGPSGLEEGDAYTFRGPKGDGLNGWVYVVDPPHQFVGTVENMNKSLLRLKFDDECNSERTPEAHICLSTYGIAQEEVADFESRFGELLKRLYA